MAIHSCDTENEHIFWVNNLHLKDINPIRCGWHQRKPGGFWGPSVASSYNLHYVLSGKGQLTCNGKTVILDKQHLFLTGADTVIKHQADPVDPWLYAWISFDGEYAKTMLEACGFTEECRHIYCPEIYGLFDDIRRLEISREVPATYLCARLYIIFDKLMNNSSRKIKENNPVNQYCIKAVDYIRANYASHITIEGISDSLGIDRRYFSRIFTKHTGVSPQKYLLDYRLERAKVLLSGGQYSVGEVASSVGYDDIFAFSKIYKKKYGFSPSKSIINK